MIAKLVAKKQLTNNIETLSFKPKESLRYVAGQFIEVTIPHKSPDDRGIRRWFTLSSAPGHDSFSLTTKFAADQPSSFKNAFRALAVGDDIQISEPMGDFVLPKDASIPLIFVAAGIGVTPYHSMIEWLIHKNQKRIIELLYIAKPHESVFHETFDQPFINTHYLQSKDRLTAQTIIKKTGQIDNKMLFLAGPEPMIEDLVKQFNTLHVPSNQIVTDYFPGYTEA